MTNEAIITALGGALTAVAGAVFAFLKWYLPWKAKNTVKTFPEVSVDISALYDVLQECRAKMGAARILVVKAHNGGGPPRITSPMYSSVLYEAYDETAPSIKPSWQNQPADEQFVHVMQALNKEKRLRLVFGDVEEAGIETKELKGPGAISAFYGAQNVLFSDACELKVTRKGYFYLVVDMVEGKNTGEYMNHLRELQTRVMGIMWPKTRP